MASGVSLVTFLLFGSVYGSWAVSDPDLGISATGWARELLDDARARSWAWSIESVSSAVLVMTSLVLMTGAKGGLRYLPRSVAWSALAVGGSLQVMALSIMLGSYPTAVQVVEAAPVLLEAATSTVSVLATTSSALVLTGLAVLMGADRGRGEPAVARIGAVGVWTCALGVALILAGTLGAVPRLAAVPVILLSRALLIVVGVRISKAAGVAGVAS